jgi:hypothetical protein
MNNLFHGPPAHPLYPSQQLNTPDPASTMRDQHSQQLQSTVTPIKLNQDAMAENNSKRTS